MAVIDFNEYKRKHDIPLPRSPYYALNATEKQVNAALNQAAEIMRKPIDRRGRTPYAVIVGYQNKETGKIKLLKEMRVFSNKRAYERGGIQDHFVIGLHQKAE